MTGSELRYDDPGSTTAAVELLRRHDAQEPEANITSAVRDFLTSTGLTKPEDIVEENPPSDSSRQAVDLTALDTFLELKQRIGTQSNPHPDHVAQLDGYLKQSEEAGRVRMGILTDGKHWLLRWPQAGPVRTVPPYLFTLESGDRWFRLYEWLKNQAFTALENIPADRSSLAKYFGPNAPALQRDIDTLRDLYQLNRERPTIQIKRQLWEDLLRTALGEVARTPGQMDELFVRHSYLTAVIGMVVQASFGIDLRAMAAIEPMSLLDGSRFRDEVGLTAVVESDFFTWPAEGSGGRAASNAGPRQTNSPLRLGRRTGQRGRHTLRDCDTTRGTQAVGRILHAGLAGQRHRQGDGGRSAESAGSGSSLRVRSVYRRGRHTLRGSCGAGRRHKPQRDPRPTAGRCHGDRHSPSGSPPGPPPPGSSRPSPSSRRWSTPTSSRTFPSLFTWETPCSSASAPAICSQSMRSASRSTTRLTPSWSSL